MIPEKIIFFSKQDVWSGYAANIARVIFGDRLEIFTGKFSDPFPEGLLDKKFDCVLSFLSPWIIPEAMLKRSSLSLNFHPAPREYPGIGCYNFALYEGAAEYGCVCHQMAPRVDTGKIIYERRFAVSPRDSVETLKLRTMVYMTALFQEVAGNIAGGVQLPEAEINWSRKPFTRKQLDGLCKISADMGSDEIKRRIRAVTYPGFPGAEIEIEGFKFRADVPARPPMA